MLNDACHVDIMLICVQINKRTRVYKKILRVNLMIITNIFVKINNYSNYFNPPELDDQLALQQFEKTLN